MVGLILIHLVNSLPKLLKVTGRDRGKKKIRFILYVLVAVGGRLG